MADPLTKDQADIQSDIVRVEADLDVLDRNLTLYGERLRAQILRDVSVVGGLSVVLGSLVGWALGRAGRSGQRNGGP